MSIELDELKAAVAQLSISERAELALTLIQSLDSDPEGEDAFEVERRAAEVDRGEVKPVPGDEAFTRLRRKFG